MYADVQLVILELEPGSEQYRIAEQAERDPVGTRTMIEEAGRRFPVIANPSLPRRLLTLDEAQALRELEQIVSPRARDQRVSLLPELGTASPPTEGSRGAERPCAGDDRCAPLPARGAASWRRP